MQWNNAIESISLGWPFLSSDSLQNLQEQCINTIRRSEMSPQYAQVLLQSLKPTTLRIGDPLAVLRRTWCSGMLAAMKCSPLLTPNTRWYAATLQVESIKTCDARTAREKCLDLIASSLLTSTEFDARTLMQWEAWMIASSNISNQESRHARYMQVIDTIIKSNLDLLRESNTRKVLGRIALESKTINSHPFRNGVLSLYNDSTATSTDLHVLGNLFYSSGNASWYSPQFILPLNTNEQERTEIVSLLAKSWVVETKALPLRKTALLPNNIDKVQLQKWQDLYGTLDRDRSVAKFLLHTRLLNEAAVYLYKGRSDLVDQVLSKNRKRKNRRTPNSPTNLL